MIEKIKKYWKPVVIVSGVLIGAVLIVYLSGYIRGCKSAKEKIQKKNIEMVK